MAEVNIGRVDDRYIVEWLIMSTEALLDTRAEAERARTMADIYDKQLAKYEDYTGVHRWDKLPERVDDDGNATDADGNVVSIGGSVVA